MNDTLLFKRFMQKQNYLPLSLPRRHKAVTVKFLIKKLIKAGKE